MPQMNMEAPKQEYDSRWFIWTIVFLVVTGISLVSYIVLSDSGVDDGGQIVHAQSLSRTPTTTSVKKNK